MITSFKGQYDFLSNFYPSTLLIYDRYYRTVEHAYQAFKTDDAVWHEKIRNAKHPAEAKRLGRLAPMRANWEETKLQAMEWLLRKKFDLPYLRQRLDETGTAVLVEGNTWGDRYWGAVAAEPPYENLWRGENYLGRLLMQIRDDLEDLPS